MNPVRNSTAINNLMKNLRHLLRLGEISGAVTGTRVVLFISVLSILSLYLSGCGNKFFDPTQVGRFRPVPAVNVILDSLGVAEEAPSVWESVETGISRNHKAPANMPGTGNQLTRLMPAHREAAAITSSERVKRRLSNQARTMLVGTSRW